MSNAVFLDRDNTLIANDGDLGEPDRVQLLDGVAEGLKALRDAGYRLIVVTNQGGVARGTFTEDDVDSVHQRIATLVDAAAGSEELVSRFYYCPYHPKATIEAYRRDHPWRKPRPGMLIQAARDMNLDLAQCWMVGDAERDVEAGRAAGCRTVLVSRKKRAIKSAKPTAAVETFADAVATILSTAPSTNGTPDAATPVAAQPPRPASRPATSPTTVSPLTAASTPPATTARPPSRTMSAEDRITGASDLKRAINDLAEELRSERIRSSEFTALRLAAGMCLLLALLLALLGILQLDNFDIFMKWMIGGALALLLANAILLLDLKG